MAVLVFEICREIIALIVIETRQWETIQWVHIYIYI